MGIKFNDSDLTIEWPEPYSLEGYIVSDKDKNLINGDADVFSSQNPMLRTLMIFYIVQGSFLPMIA